MNDLCTREAQKFHFPEPTGGKGQVSGQCSYIKTVAILF